MHVAVLGAGALGCVYGVRLALRTRASMTFVVRKARATSREPLVIERVKDVRDRRREELLAPVRSTEIPGDADVILLAVGTEDLEAIRPVLDASSAPIVVLTPMMPADYTRMRKAFGERVLAAMPSLVSYAREHEVRYWLPPAPTRIDEPRAGSDATAVRALVALLGEAALPAHLELGVHEANPATTVCFIPIGMAVGLAGGLRELANDAPLLSLTSRACSEGLTLARRIGRPEPGALAAPLVATPLAMRAVVAGLARFMPEALHYVDVHFGQKLRAQHRVMAREIARLARLKEVPHRAIDELALRLDEASISFDQA